MVAPHKICPPGTYECDLIWKKNLCQRHQVRADPKDSLNKNNSNTLGNGTLLCFFGKHCNKRSGSHSVSLLLIRQFFALQSENHSTNVYCAPTTYYKYLACLQDPPENSVNAPLCSLVHLRCVLLKTPAKVCQLRLTET